MKKLNYIEKNKYRDFLFNHEKDVIGEGLEMTYSNKIDLGSLNLLDDERKVLKDIFNYRVCGREFFMNVEKIFEDFYRKTGYRVTYKDLISDTLVIYKGDKIEKGLENKNIQGLSSSVNLLDIADLDLENQMKVIKEFDKCTERVKNYYLFAGKIGSVEKIYDRKGIEVDKVFTLDCYH